MNRTIAIAIATLWIAATISAGRINCSQMGCPNCCNDNKIGAVCYDNGAYDCVTDNFGALALCSKGGRACNGNCYDPNNYHCVNGGIVQGRENNAQTKAATTTQAPQTTTQPPTTSTQPPQTTTQPPQTTTQAPQTTTSSPVNLPGFCGSNVCIGQSCCGKNQCYQSSQHSCVVDGVTGVQQLCPVNQRSCNGGCYDPKNYNCKNGGLNQGAETGGNSGSTTSSPVVVNPIPVPVPIKTTQTPTTASPSNGNNNGNNNGGNYNFPSQSADLRIINNCKYTLWFEGRYGGKGIPIPGFSQTATKATPGSYVDYTVPSTGLSGSRFWAKYGCDDSGKNCKIGDQMQYYPEGGCPTGGCTAPIDSLFEATWGCKPGSACATSNPTTWFDTSQVDGYTIPYKVTVNGQKERCDCSGNKCGLDFIDATNLDLGKCPSGDNLSANGAFTSTFAAGATRNLASVDLRVMDKTTNEIIGCYSPCKKLSYDWNINEGSLPTLYYCCPTPNPANCQIGQGCISSEACRNGPVENSQYVKSIHSMAPGIYTYAYDDGVGLHACPAGVVTYTMEFCPAGSSAYPHPA